MDEILELNQKYNNIQNFLEDKIFEKCENIKINWLWYYDEKLLYYENKSFQERIKVFRYDNPVNKHIIINIYLKIQLF